MVTFLPVSSPEIVFDIFSLQILWYLASFTSFGLLSNRILFREGGGIDPIFQPSTASSWGSSTQVTNSLHDIVALQGLVAVQKTVTDKLAKKNDRLETQTANLTERLTELKNKLIAINNAIGTETSF